MLNNGMGKGFMKNEDLKVSPEAILRLILWKEIPITKEEVIDTIKSFTNENDPEDVNFIKELQKAIGWNPNM